MHIHVQVCMCMFICFYFSKQILLTPATQSLCSHAPAATRRCLVLRLCAELKVSHSPFLHLNSLELGRHSQRICFSNGIIYIFITSKHFSKTFSFITCCCLFVLTFLADASERLEQICLYMCMYIYLTQGLQEKFGKRTINYLIKIIFFF